MQTAIIFDCEFLTAPGAPQRFWCGPDDPDPQIVQIGAVKLGLGADAPLLDRLRLFVAPIGRNGAPCDLDPFFIRLTGITPEQIRSEGQPLDTALAQLEAFADGADFWSWGKDEFNLIAISCYVAGLAPPIPITRFGNACELVRKAGMPTEDINRTRSNTLADYYGVADPDQRAHDALDDANSVALALQHLLREGRLHAADFDR